MSQEHFSRASLAHHKQKKTSRWPIKGALMHEPKRACNTMHWEARRHEQPVQNKTRGQYQPHRGTLKNNSTNTQKLRRNGPLATQDANQ